MKKKSKTKAERDFMNKVAEIGCIVCYLETGVEGTPACLHHLREGMGMGMKNDNYHVIPLCEGHHQWGDGTPAQHGKWGYHKNKTEFEKRYGTAQSLFDKLQEML